MGIEWEKEEIIEYIGKVLETYSKSYSRNAKNQYMSLREGKRLEEYVRRLGQGVVNFYNHKNIGLRVDEV